MKFLLPNPFIPKKPLPLILSNYELEASFMKTQTLFILMFFSISLSTWSQNYKESIAHFQTELNQEFADSNHSPLDLEQLKTFTALNFYPINEKFRITAKFVKNNNPLAINMKTTTERLPVYDVFGKAKFKIDDKEYVLNIYQSHSLREKEAYKSYLFLPFNDLTNGEETYGGGRYIDLEIPENDSLIIDFNKAYHPYCTYNKKYSCPIPPAENFIELKIEAGIKN